MYCMALKKKSLPLASPDFCLSAHLYKMSLFQALRWSKDSIIVHIIQRKLRGIVCCPVKQEWIGCNSNICPRPPHLFPKTLSPDGIPPLWAWNSSTVRKAESFCYCVPSLCWHRMLTPLLLDLPTILVAVRQHLPQFPSFHLQDHPLLLLLCWPISLPSAEFACLWRGASNSS